MKERNLYAGTTYRGKNGRLRKLVMLKPAGPSDGPVYPEGELLALYETPDGSEAVCLAATFARWADHGISQQVTA